MGIDDISPQAFEDWLRTDKNKIALEKIATNVYRKMQRTNLHLPGVDTRLIDPEDIYQELTIFLLSDQVVMKELLVGGPGIMNRLQGYLWHRMLDMSRSREANQDIYKDTWRLFYRHILDVMGKSNQFVKAKADSGSIVFGRTHEQPRTIIMMEDLVDIPYPQELPADFQALNTKNNILKLAEYFWDQAAQKFGEPHIQLSVRDFMFWIGKYVALTNEIESYPETNDDKTKKNPLSMASQNQENILKKQNLTSWADNFCHLLKGVEKKVFYYYECKGLKHKDISDLMGKKGNLSYSRDKIRDRLKAFLRPLDWVSPEHDGMEPNDPADFIFFRDTLCSLLSAAIQGA